LADTVFVNVGGTWKTVSDYYVNVNGTWKTGAALQANISGTWSSISTSSLLPTYLQLATLDFAEFMSVPAVFVASKSTVADNTTLDLKEFLCKPTWFLSSSFVYSAPGGGGGSTPANNLPVFTENYNLDTYIEYTVIPTIRAATRAGIDLDPLDYKEYTAAPFWGNKNSSTYTAPSGGGGGTPPASILPTRQNLLTLDYKQFMAVPIVMVNAKANLTTSTLDFQEFMSLPHYTAIV